MTIQFYKRHISESRFIIYVSTFIALLLRIGTLYSSNGSSPIQDGGPMWDYLAPLLFSNAYISFGIAFLLTIGIAIYAGHLNEKYSLIRVRTNLPYAFIVFLFACFPPYAFVCPAYIGILLFLSCLNILFSSYQAKEVAHYAVRISVAFSVGSLFAPILLIYIPIFLVGFYLMRSFSFKVILGSVVGFLVVFWLVAFGLLYTENLVPYLEKTYASLINFEVFSLLDLQAPYWTILILITAILLVIIVHNYANEFKDKIQVRANMTFINILFILSIIVFVLLSIHPETSLLIVIFSSSFIYSHYFSQIEKKWEIFFFLSLLILYLITYFSFLIQF